MLRKIPGPLRRPLQELLPHCRFVKDFRAFRRFQSPRFSLRWRDRQPQLHDDLGFTPFDSHYIYHPAWAARILAETRPASHIDISSTLHFCTLISAFIPVTFYDYRPAALALSGLESRRADLTHLPFADGSILSLSCMHTVEHIGFEPGPVFPVPAISPPRNVMGEPGSEVSAWRCAGATLTDLGPVTIRLPRAPVCRVCGKSTER